MKFKNSRQRKAVMAKLKCVNYNPNDIMDYDNKLWNKYGVSSLTELEQKGFKKKYVMVMKKKFPKPMSRKTMQVLENENYHSAYSAIGYC